eukprot:CCRYP_018128-RA/>CCRYP_018128-RA protein AED:0.04 eAED:0.04 QI:874/1/1/1/1/1/3/451/571
MTKLFRFAILSQLLPTATATLLDLHAKELDNPFPDDPSIVLISPVQDHGVSLHASSTSRRLQQSSSVTKCPSSEQALWSLSLLADSNPSQTKWSLKQPSTKTLMLVGPPSDQQYEANTLYKGEVCIRKGFKYVFRIQDAGGDGLCCESGTGGFTMSVDGEVFVDRMERNDNWGTKNFLFYVGNLTESAAPKPTPRPTTSPTETRNETEAPTYAAIQTNSPTVAAVITDSPTASPEIVTVGVLETYSPTPEPEKEVAVSFIMMGDIPYYTNHKYCLNQQLRELTPAQMEYPYAFIVHVGDIKSGQTKDCVSEYFSDVADIFSSPLNDYYYDTRDCFFLVGDNDWCDCDDPGSAFAYWMNNFGNGRKYTWINRGPNPNGFGTFSHSNMRTTLEYDDDGSSDSSQYYPSSASNFAFFLNKVLFVGINQVGGAEIGDESTRVRNNFNWVKNKMETYAQLDMRSLVVFAHAPMSGARWEYFGQPFQSFLRDNYPDILVLYAHGDGHKFNLERIDKYNANLYDLECDSGDIADPLLITITRSGSERDGLNVDRRGGRYPDGDCAPDNRDKTWSSNLF